jgi:DNA polymerase III delta subunit
MIAQKKNILIHFLTGSEDSSKQKYVEEILLQHPDLNRDLCVFKFDLKVTPIEEVMSKARTFPFGSEVQIIMVRFGRKMNKAEMSILQEYLDGPVPFSIVICDGSDDIDFKDLDRKGITTRFDSDKQVVDLRAIVLRRFKDENKRISSSALRLFLDRCGEEVGRVYTCLDYLILFAGDKGEITENDVRTVVAESISYGSFDLANALVAKQSDRVLEIFRDATEHGISPQDIMGMVHWQLRRVFEAKVMLFHGRSREDIRKELRIGPSFLDGFISTIQRFDMAAIEKAIRGLTDLDYAIKTGKSDVQLGLERYFLELVN